MVKLRALCMGNMNELPDHILEEIDVLGKEILSELFPLLESHSPNIILAAFNRVHAGLLKSLISNDHKELEKATIFTCKSLINNINLILETE